MKLSEEFKGGIEMILPNFKEEVRASLLRNGQWTALCDKKIKRKRRNKYPIGFLKLLLDFAEKENLQVYRTCNFLGTDKIIITL